MIDIIELMDKPQTDVHTCTVNPSWQTNRHVYYTRVLRRMIPGEGQGFARMWVERSEKTSEPKYELPIDPKPFTLEAVVEILVQRERELAA